MEKINFRKERIPFTQVANEVLNDRKLSAKAKGLYAYLYSKPEGWDFAIERIAQDFSDGERSIRSGIQELEAQGYLYRERQPSGRVVYVVASQLATLAKPQEGSKPPLQNAPLAKRPPGETAGVSNKEIKVIKSISNKESTRSVQVAEVIKAFEAVDPKNKLYYGNTTQRSACIFLIAEYTFDEVLKRIGYLSRTNKLPYFPNITTPVQLRDKWKSLEDAVERKKAEVASTKRVVI